MNKLKEKAEEEKPLKEGGNASVRGMKGLLSGRFLSRERAVRSLPFLFFVTFLCLCYIANGFQAEKLVRKLYKTTNELKELRSEYITTKSDLMYISKQSQVAKATAYLGLKELTAPPKKIVVTKKDKEAILK